MGQSKSKPQPESKPDPQTPPQWEWKSNPNPYSLKEPPQWAPHAAQENDLLERAYYTNKDEVDLGKYIVSLKFMRQIEKKNNYNQRPV